MVSHVEEGVERPWRANADDLSVEKALFRAMGEENKARSDREGRGFVGFE